MMRKLLMGTAAAMLVGLSLMPTAKAATVYCKYVGVPKGCVAKPGVVYKPAPAVRAAATPGVGAPGVNTPTNRGGPVNRVGRR